MAAEDLKITAAIWFMPLADVTDRLAWLKDPDRLFAPLPWDAVTGCGAKIVFTSLAGVPLDDSPCNCGRAGCFVVKWDPRAVVPVPTP